MKQSEIEGPKIHHQMNRYSTIEQDELQELILSLKENKEDKLRAIYHAYRDEFLAWAQRNTALAHADLLDVYQETIITFYKKVIKGQIQSLEASIKTYLFAIAKNKIKKQYQKQAKFILKDEFSDALLPPEPPNSIQQINHEHLEFILTGALNKLGEKCHQLLKLSFYHNYALEAIARQLEYKNSQVVSSKLYKCLQRLGSLINDKI